MYKRQTVELVADATLDERIIIEDGETITLDLGEFSVTPSDSRFGRQNLFTNRGTFTVKGQEMCIRDSPDPAGAGDHHQR